jgi:4,4'-diaponeurosporenoate glycosyltransferase
VLGHPSVWLAAYAVIALQLRSILHAVGAFRWWTWALFPVPLLAFDAVFSRSAVLTLVRRSVRWRGREVRLEGRAEDGA